MNNEWLNEEFLRKFYTDDNVVVPAEHIEELIGDDIWELDCFHAKAVVMVEQNDDYLCGMRANHFVVEIGTSERDYDETKEEGAYVYFLVSANHKGMRMTTLFRVTKELVPQA